MALTRCERTIGGTYLRRRGFGNGLSKIQKLFNVDGHDRPDLRLEGIYGSRGFPDNDAGNPTLTNVDGLSSLNSVGRDSSEVI